MTFDPDVLVDTIGGAYDLDDLKFFWAMECGNDGVLLEGSGGLPQVPEPFSMLVFGTGMCAAVGHYVRRKRH